MNKENSPKQRKEDYKTQEVNTKKASTKTVNIIARYRFDNRNVEDSLMLVEPENAPLMLGTRFMSREIDRIRINLTEVNNKKVEVEMKPWDETYKRLARDIRDKKVDSLVANITVKKGILEEDKKQEQKRSGSGKCKKSKKCKEQKTTESLMRLEEDKERQENSLERNKKPKRDVNIHGMFEWVVWLEEVEGLEELVTEDTVELQNMFAECKRLKKVKGTEKWDTQNVENASFMFKGCKSMKETPAIEKWDMRNCVFLAGMFQNCKSLKMIGDISSWNTENVVDISLMFMNCKNLNRLPDLSKWSTKRMARINSIFWGCSSLVEVPDISKWDTSGVGNMSGLFRGCASLISIPDISVWDTKKVGNELEDANVLLFYEHDVEGIYDRCNPNVEYQSRDIFEGCPNMIAEHMRNHLFCKHYLEHRMDIGRINIFNIYFPGGMELTPWG